MASSVRRNATVATINVAASSSGTGRGARLVTSPTANAAAAATSATPTGRASILAASTLTFQAPGGGAESLPASSLRVGRLRADGQMPSSKAIARRGGAMTSTDRRGGGAASSKSG